MSDETKAKIFDLVWTVMLTAFGFWIGTKIGDAIMGVMK